MCSGHASCFVFITGGRESRPGYWAVPFGLCLMVPCANYIMTITYFDLR
jgi:hypothetical protein